MKEKSKKIINTLDVRTWKYFDPEFDLDTPLTYEWIDSAWIGHIHFGYDLVRNVKPLRIVELGSHYGHSFFAFCQAVKDGGLKSELTAIDTWQGDSHAGTYDESVFKKVNDIKNTYYKNQKVTLLRMTFDEAVSTFEDGSIDLLHIDGLHSYNAVSHDFKTWFKKVSKNGIIIFHDTHEHRKGFGVYRLWNELKKRFITTEFQHSHGLGVLFKGVRPLHIDFISNIWPKYYKIMADKRWAMIELKRLWTSWTDIDSRIKTQEKETGKLKKR